MNTTTTSQRATNILYKDLQEVKYMQDGRVRALRWTVPRVCL